MDIAEIGFHKFSLSLKYLLTDIESFMFTIPNKLLTVCISLKTDKCGGVEHLQFIYEG